MIIYILLSFLMMFIDSSAIELSNSKKRAASESSEDLAVKARTIRYRFLRNAKKQNEQGDTMLHIACKSGDLNQVYNLVMVKSDIELKNNRGLTPLHTACENGHLDIVKYLGGNLKVNLEVKALDDATPLYIACESGHDEILKYLLYLKANPSAPLVDGHTPLHVACEHGNLNAVTSLLLYGKANIEAKNFYGVTPLDIARSANHIDIYNFMMFILEKTE